VIVGGWGCGLFNNPVIFLLRFCNVRGRWIKCEYGALVEHCWWENQNIQAKSSPSTTLTATNSTWTGVGLNQEKTKILNKNVSHCQVVQHRFHILLLCHIVPPPQTYSQSPAWYFYLQKKYFLSSLRCLTAVICVTYITIQMCMSVFLNMQKKIKHSL